MEEYFAGLDSLNNRALIDAQFFVDQMRDVIDGRFDGTAEADGIRMLPAKTNFEVEANVKQDIEVLLIMTRTIATKIIKTELLASGYRVVTETEPFTTIETAIRTCPDLILAAAVMEDLSGIDLACAIRAGDKPRTNASHFRRPAAHRARVPLGEGFWRRPGHRICHSRNQLGSGCA